MNMLRHNDVEEGALALPSPPLPVDAANYLSEFFALFPPFVLGDTLATTFCSCKVILLTVVVTGDFRSYTDIAALTGLPLSFITTCGWLMKRSGLIYSTGFSSLQSAVQENQAGYADVEDWLDAAQMVFWDSAWSTNLQSLLTHCRDGYVFGGRTLDAFDCHFLEDLED
jgi:hypothetical protein